MGRDESGLAIIQSQRGDIVRAWLAGNAAIGDGDPVLYIPPGPGEVLGQVQLATVLPVPGVRIFDQAPLGGRVAMVLDANWCYFIDGSVQPEDTPENIQFLELLAQGNTTVITPPIDSRVQTFAGVAYSPLSGGAGIAAAAGLTIVEQPLDATANGFLWLPLLLPAQRYTATELEAITRCGQNFGAIMIGDTPSWAGVATSYNGHLISLFDPDLAVTVGDDNTFDQTLLVEDIGTLNAPAVAYWPIDAPIPEENIIGVLTPDSGGSTNPATGRPGAIWLT